MRAAGIVLGRLVFIVASAAVVVLGGGGVAFLGRPVGATYVVLWVIWWAATFLGRRRGEPSAYDTRQNALVMALSVVAVPALVLGPPWEYAHLSGPIPRDTALSWVGMALFAMGIALQSWAMWALHGAYTVRLRVPREQGLVTTGPYRIVRHPGYLSYLLSLFGIGLALSSLIAFGLTVLVLIFLRWRIVAEEEMLVAEFGDEYRAYAVRTKTLIPLIY